MTLTPLEWHQRYLQQARWTRSLRDYLYRQVRIASARRVLDVGCGTGALEAELDQRTGAGITGLDLSIENLSLAAKFAPGCQFTGGDALSLPFADNSFDMSLCHFFLLWMADTAAALKEMKRVTKPGGAILALAEPDYGGRIDYPDELARLGAWQAEALRRQGADPALGRKLKGAFVSVGLDVVETGVLGGQWRQPDSSEEFAGEWTILKQDLEQIPDLPTREASRLYEVDRQARASGIRLLFVPTFYAWGVKA